MWGIWRANHAPTPVGEARVKRSRTVGKVLHFLKLCLELSGLFMLYYLEGTPCEMFQEQQLVQSLSVWVKYRRCQWKLSA